MWHGADGSSGKNANSSPGLLRTRGARTLPEMRRAASRIHDAELLSTGDSNRTFDAFSQAVDALSQANQGHYNMTYAATRGALMLYVALSAILFPLLGLAAVAGIVLRLIDF